MNRRDVLLTLLAAANGRTYTPAQLQKAMFLITDNASSLVSEGRNYRFVPHNYGPFDSTVYEDCRVLRNDGLAETSPSEWGHWPVYSATDDGVQHGEELLGHMDQAYQQYIREVSDWVRAQSFSSLVRSIYEEYPEMRENSIFRD